MSMETPRSAEGYDDLERFFLQDIDDLGDDAEDADWSDALRPGKAEAETPAGGGGADHAADAGTATDLDWEEFLSSATQVSDRLVVFEADIADVSLNPSERVAEKASAAATGRGSSPSLKSPEIDDACEQMGGPGSDEDVEVRRAAVAVVLEDMLLSLEQLWATMASAAVAAVTSAPPPDEGYESQDCCRNLHIIEDTDYQEDFAHEPIELGGECGTASVSESFKILQELEKIALQNSLTMEHEAYLREEEECRRQEEEELARVQRRRARRAEEALRRKERKASILIQSHARGYLAHQRFQNILAEEMLRRLKAERAAAACEEASLGHEDLRSRLAWQYVIELESQERERRRLLEEEEERRRRAEVEEQRRRAEVEEQRRRAEVEEQRRRAEVEQRVIEEKERQRLALEQAQTELRAIEEDRLRLAEQKSLITDVPKSTSGDDAAAKTGAAKSSFSAKTSVVGGKQKSGWGGMIVRSSAVPEETTEHSGDSSLACEHDASRQTGNRHNHTESADTVFCETVNCTKIKADPVSPLTLSVIEKATMDARIWFDKRSSNAERAVCCVGDEKGVEKANSTPPVISAASALSGGHAAWMKWSSSQTTYGWDIYADISAQNRFADNVENLYRLSAAGDSRNIAEYTVENLESLDFLSNRVDLRHLILNVNRISSLKELTRLVELDSLSVKDNHIKSLDGLENLGKLRSLVIDVNQVHDMSAARGLASLIVLSASTNSISEIPRLDSPHLQRLNLYHNKITAVESLSCIRSRVLTHLDLGRNKLEVVSGEALSQCQLLIQLVLSQNLMNSVPAPLRLPNLKRLWISGNRLTELKEWSPHVASDGSIEYPCFLPSLEKLFLQDNMLQSLNEYTFSSMALLSHIDISFNNIGQSLDEATVNRELNPLKDCALLRSVQLQDNPIGVHRVAIASALLPSCPDLKEVSGVAVSDIVLNMPQNIASVREAEDNLALLMNGYSAGATAKHSLGAESKMTAFAHPFSGVISEMKNRCVSATRSALEGSNLKSSSEFAALKELVCCSSSSVTAEKSLTKHHAKLAKQTAAEENGTTPAPSSAYDPLLNSGIESASALIHLLRNTKQLLAGPSDFSSSRVTMYSTVDSRGDFGSLNPEREFIKGNQQVEYVAACKLVTLIQKTFRGHSIRAQIKKALETVEYQDDELDDVMFGDNILDDLSIPELDDDYWKVKTLKKATVSEEFTTAIQNTATAMVYGDHIKARSNSSRNSNRHSESAGTSAGSSDQLTSGLSAGDFDRAGSRTGWAEAVSTSKEFSKHVEKDENGVDVMYERYPPLSSRPSTNMSDASVASSQAHSVDDFEYLEQDSTKSTPREHVDKNMIIAQEWGFTDPNVIAAMKKRNKRMQGFATAKEKREKTKHADERLKQFVRQAARRPNEGSGSFGGKPKQFKGVRHRQQAAVHPAWLGGDPAGGQDVGDNSN